MLDKKSMNTYNAYMKIEWKRKALKQIIKIPDTDRKRIAIAVRVLYDFPNVQNVKTLTNHKYDYRLRVGRYRVLFNHYETVQIISIEEVKKRDDTTY